MEIRHPGLRRFWQQGDASRLNPAQVARIRRILTALAPATNAHMINYPGFRIHRLRGNRSNYWSIRVSRNWRITFRFVGGRPVDVNLEDYH